MFRQQNCFLKQTFFSSPELFCCREIFPTSKILLGYKKCSFCISTKHVYCELCNVSYFNSIEPYKAKFPKVLGSQS